jgi:uncharacterized membrane protein (UPF0127 family)
MAEKNIFIFNYKGRKIRVNNFEECRGYFSKARGLMFRKKEKCKSLIFYFNKSTKQGIHSFFVSTDFIAVWFLKNKIIDVKYVKPWKFLVKPDKEYDKLLEIPSSDSNFNFFVGKNRKV